MTTCKLIFRNVRRNIRDYLVYYLTLTLAVGMFYAFNSIASQSAFADMSATRALLYQQLGTLLSALSVVIAVVLAFLVVYANQFILKRRKKELGIYLLAGMRKGRISRLFAGETLLVGLLALGSGLLAGVVLSQGLSLVSMRLFAVEVSGFRFVLSAPALRLTVLCFAVIFVLVGVFNVLTVSGVKLIDLLTARRKNETLPAAGPAPVLLFAAALALIGAAAAVFHRHGILPVRGESWVQLGAGALAVGTVLLFYSASAVGVRLAQADRRRYLKGLTAFVVRQLDSRLRTNFLVMAAVCGILTVTIVAVGLGAGTALAMNRAAQAAVPYDLNVLSDVDQDGDTDIAAYLRTQGVDLAQYARSMEQVAMYNADLTYGQLLAGQELELWRMDQDLPDIPVAAVSLSDFNRALAMQGKPAVTLADDQYLLNCNYEGTLGYLRQALADHPTLTVAGVTLHRGSDTLLNETWFMTQVGNNDRGTLVLPDAVAARLEKDANILLVCYREGTDPDEVLALMLPIGLDESHGYRYTEKTMMYDAYYGSSAVVAFLCSYVGLVFLLLCAALLALKQLTETSDNIARYGLLQKLGASPRQIDRAVLGQTAVFFAAPLAVAVCYAAFLLGQGIQLVEDFMHLRVTASAGVTAAMFVLVYGGYFAATCLSCRRMVREKRPAVRQD